jgi:N4-(beta-N-acetylglucosaminyl)-L-asparaginase
MSNLPRRRTAAAIVNLNRTEFLGVGSAAPAILLSRPVKPIVLATANGNQFKNGGTQTCVERAFDGIARGEDVLDALIAGANINELDPLDDSVGYGGLPNAEGVVQLDSCCMHGPKRWAGGVAAIEGVKTPSLVSKAVMEQTDNHLLAGMGAQQFARAIGLPIEADLNTAHSRALWLEWKRRTDGDHYLDPAKRDRISAAAESMIHDGLVDIQHYWGTIVCAGMNAAGDLGAVNSSSGLAWKIPGRTGDAAILGAGLYVDNEIGAVGSTGRGESNQYTLSSMYIIERMRAGRAPKDAVVDALRRVRALTTDKRLINSRGAPRFGLTFYVLSKSGSVTGVSFYSGGKFVVRDEDGTRTIPVDNIFPGQPFD